MENIMTIAPSITMLAPTAASNAALVAYHCATSAPSLVAAGSDVQGIAARAWDGDVKRPVTPAAKGLVAFVTTTVPGSPAWSSPT